MDDVKREKMVMIMKQLEEGVSNVFTSENYLHLLQTMSRFHHYSFNNCILVLSQNPLATIEKAAREIMNWCTLHSDLKFIVSA